MRKRCAVKNTVSKRAREKEKPAEQIEEWDFVPYSKGLLITKISLISMNCFFD